MLFDKNAIHDIKNCAKYPGDGYHHEGVKVETHPGEKSLLIIISSHVYSSDLNLWIIGLFHSAISSSKQK